MLKALQNEVFLTFIRTFMTLFTFFDRAALPLAVLFSPLFSDAVSLLKRDDEDSFLPERGKYKHKTGIC